MRKILISRQLDVVTATPCSAIYRLYLGKSSLFFKFLLSPQKFQLNNYDLSCLLRRDRLAVSKYIYQILKKQQKINKYLPPDLWTLPKHNLIITTEDCYDLVSLDSLITIKRSKFLSPKIFRLTLDWFGSNIKLKSCPKLLNNNDIWKLKAELQFIKPLSSIMSLLEAKTLVKKLGPIKYIAHGDLQPKNILMSKNKVRVVDFDEGFLGPISWDCGFLWGNLLYLSAAYHNKFYDYYNLWLNLRKSIYLAQVKVNFTIITIAILLMRIHLFQLKKISKNREAIFKKNIAEVIKYIKK